MNYSAIQTAELFSVARETIRKWAIEFDSYLSATARPPSGGIRRFTPDDLEVFALVAEMKGQGKVYEAIHAALQNGQRGQIPELPSTITTPNNHALALTARVTALEAELNSVNGENRLLKIQLAEKDNKIEALNLRIGRLLGPE